MIESRHECQIGAQIRFLQVLLVQRLANRVGQRGAYALQQG